MHDTAHTNLSQYYLKSFFGGFRIMALGISIASETIDGIITT